VPTHHLDFVSASFTLLKMELMVQDASRRLVRRYGVRIRQDLFQMIPNYAMHGSFPQ
jgi:hypothetical protein